MGDTDKWGWDDMCFIWAMRDGAGILGDGLDGRFFPHTDLNDGQSMFGLKAGPGGGGDSPAYEVDRRVGETGIRTRYSVRGKSGG